VTSKAIRLFGSLSQLNAVVSATLLSVSILAGQGLRVEGGITGGTARTPPGDPRDAILMTPEEFRSAEPALRQRVLAAWATGLAASAGNRILPLIESALLDPDRTVRQHAITALRNIENSATTNRMKGAPVVTDPTAQPSMLATLHKLLSHQDAMTRQGAAMLLFLHESSPGENTEKVVLQAMVTETDARTRANMIRVLAARVRLGSKLARGPLVSALSERETAIVRVTAIGLVGRLLLPEAIPRLVEILFTDDVMNRRQAAKTLLAFGNDLRPYCSAIEQRMNDESDAETKAAVTQLIDKCRRVTRP
jgi:HEAT repeat protein